MKAENGTPRHALTRSTRADKLLVELLAGHPVGDAAKRAGIPRRTAVRIRKDADFQARYRAARSELLDGAISRMHSGASAAVATLAEIAADSRARRHDRVSAARELLAALYRGVETVDFSTRLAALEGIAGGEK